MSAARAPRRGAAARGGGDASTQAQALGLRLWPRIEAALRARRPPLLVGISGLQGSGKSTLAAALQQIAQARGVRSVCLSLDDFYLGRAARQRLARTQHPLLVTRGVPGTHDLPLLRATLQALLRAPAGQRVRVPRFDKGRDTRRAPAQWPHVASRPSLILLEGWCLGVPAQLEAQLHRPCNALERNEDADGRWRHYVNARLRAYQGLWRMPQLRIWLRAPDFASARRWREQAEQERRRHGAPHALSPAQLQHFVAHYQRISEHAQHSLQHWADVRVDLDAGHRVRRVRRPQRGA